MNRLSVRIALAIALTTLLAVALVAVVVNRSAGSEFRRYLAVNDTALSQRLATNLVQYYAQNGSWAGVDSLDLTSSPGQGRGRSQGTGQGRGQATLVVDAQGQVVFDSEGDREGQRLSQGDLEVALPLVLEGRTLGYLLVIHGASSELPAQEQAFLDRVNATLLLAAVVALFISTVLGLLLARTLTAPLRRLALAAQAIAGGDLSQRVPVQGAVETQVVSRSFNQMAENLEQAEQLRRNLVADVAHELRTPLTVIQGNLQALLDGVFPLERAEIAAIYDETLLLSRLVNDLGELARAEAGQLHLQVLEIELAGVVARAMAGFAPAAEAKHVDLQVDLPVSLPPVLADPDRLGQVLRNLLSNALRHTPEDGVVKLSAALRISAGPPALAEPGAGPTASSGASQVVVKVADSGPGLAPEDLPYVFERFWRSDRARSRDKGGSGLGLAITRYLVEAMGGEIGVVSKPGQGSEFWFTLRASV